MEYIDVSDARERTGLRLVLTEGVPGPWSEAAKGIFHAKGLDYVAVRQQGGGSNAELQEWTGQSSAPVAIWNDDPPYTTSRGILWLAERLAPKPALMPEEPEARALFLGLCDEIHAEMGFGWCRRLVMFNVILSALPPDDGGAKVLRRMALKYGHSEEAVEIASARVLEILGLLSRRLEEQQAMGSRYLFGDSLSALDIYWATFAALLSPLPPDVCPMPDYLRVMYTAREPEVLAALDPKLLAHRDRIYREHLQFPLEF